MRIKLETLSPVHIGSGKEISPIEYLVGDDFTRLNMDGLFSDPDFQPRIEQFISAAKIQRYIGNLLPQELLRKHPLYTLRLQGEAKGYLRTNQIVVKEFIKSAGRVYIPGSSLKGSILSAMIWFAIKEKGAEGKRFVDENLRNGGRYTELLDFAFSEFGHATEKRFTHWLDISDSNLRVPEEVLQISLAKVTGGRGRSQLPILYETLQAGHTFYLEVKSQKSRFSEREVLKIADDFYRKVAAKDGGFSWSGDGFLIRLGQGSTAYSTSLLILSEELGVQNYRVQPPRTRKRIDGNTAFGWVKLTLD